MRKTMFNAYNRLLKIAVLIFCSGLLACANTSLTHSWKHPEHNRMFNHLLIIGVSDSQQTRRIFENYFAEQLKKRDTMATPSYLLINSKQVINRDTVVNAIQGTGIDAVLVIYLVSVDEEVIVHHDSPLNPGYSGTPGDNMLSATIITKRGRATSSDIINLKSDLYDVEGENMIWSRQTRTAAPESIDQAIIDVTHLLIEELEDDRLIK
jgi:hypothetical protein